MKSIAQLLPVRIRQIKRVIATKELLHYLALVDVRANETNHQSFPDEILPQCFFEPNKYFEDLVIMKIIQFTGSAGSSTKQVRDKPEKGIAG